MPNEAIEDYVADTLREVARRAGIDAKRVALEAARPEFGDLSSNLALEAAAEARRPPKEIAEEIAASFPTSPDLIAKVTVAGAGFINFHLGPNYLRSLVQTIIRSPERYGACEGSDERWIFEFVSANPTGSLNIVSARAASVGDALVRILKRRGITAASEYYVNDGGGQVANLGASLSARIAELDGRAAEAIIPEGGYHGLEIVELAKAWRSENPVAPVFDDAAIGRWAADRIRAGQEKTLRRFRVLFDRWFRESELYADGRVSGAYDMMVKGGVTYEKEGAVFFRASSFGDSDDRVLRTSEGRFTYIVPDIAYHHDKWHRGFRRAVTILGPDHHGHIAQLQAALKASSLPAEFLVPLMIQQVNLRRGGEEIKMSKRAGVTITLDELLDEVGIDAARYFFLMRRSSSHLDFDIDLALRHSEDNPVYYVQYAHARIQSIFRQPGAVSVDADTDVSPLTEPEETVLMRTLARFPWTLAAVVRSLEPHPLTVYLSETARAFHLFYQRHRVISDDTRVTAARLALCHATADVLREGLGLMGVDAPERM